VCSVGGVAGPAGAADRVVATNVGFNPDAFLGTFAWSDQRGRLVLLSRGRTRLAPVRRFRGLVDPSLGPGRHGAPVAAYPRCAGSNSGLGCDLFVLGLRSGREHKLRSLSTKSWSESAVGVWGSRYLFARRRCTASNCFSGGLFVSRPLRRLSRAFVGEVDLRGRVAAFTVTPPAAELLPVSIRVVFLSRRGRVRQCVLATVRRFNGGYEDNGFYSPVVTRRFVYWVASPQELAARPPSVLRRRIPSRTCAQRGRVQTLRSSSGQIQTEGVAVTRGRVYYTGVNPDVPGPRSLFEMTDPLVRDP
jgi:hypothetical protein